VKLEHPSFPSVRRAPAPLLLGLSRACAPAEA